MSSLQAQLLSAKRNLSTAEESSSHDKSILQSKLTETQQHLKEVKAENELKKVCSYAIILQLNTHSIGCI